LHRILVDTPGDPGLTSRPRDPGLTSRPRDRNQQSHPCDGAERLQGEEKRRWP
jgi:hypothetical protein